MSPRVTVGMLAILLALAAYVYYGPTPALAPGAASVPGAPPGAPGGMPTPKPQDPALDLWTTDETQVQSVFVQKGAQQAGFQRDGDGWIVTPAVVPGDRLRINSLVFRLANVRATYKVQNPTSDAEFGLNTPSLIATIGLANGNALRLTVGAKAVGETGTYARKDGDPAVYVVSNALVQDLDRIVTEPPVPASPTPLPSPAAEASPSPNP
jgi:hypothetical protein